MDVAFIGLGQMGAPMARRLLQEISGLTVYDMTSAARSVLVAEGAVEASSISSCVQDADVVILMLPNSQIVSSVVLGDNGVCASLREGAVIVDMSSSHPVETQKLHQALKAKNIRLVDAPVSGGVQRAEVGTLAIMAGGHEQDIHTVEPLLKIMGSSLISTGPVGSAHALKALNNLLSASGLIAAAEVLLIGQRFGLETSKMLEALNVSSGMNNSTKNKFPSFVLPRTFASGFSLDLMVKDLSIALNLAEKTETSTPSSAKTFELAQAAQSLLGAGADHTEAIKLLEKMNDEEIGVHGESEGEAGDR